MKPAWPNIPLSRWSKRLLSTISLFIAAVFLVTGLSVPVHGAIQPTTSAPIGTEAGADMLLAQEPNTSGNAILYFTTPVFTVSVFPRGSQNPLMNVYNRDTRQSEQINAPANFRGALANDGWVSYDSFGSRNGGNVIYRASANRNAFQARFEIIDAASNSVLISQNSTGITAFNIPGVTPGSDDNLLARTLVGFETQNYTVRVFTEAGVTKMNVFNKPSGQQVVNGQPATAEVPGTSPYECWVTYFGGQGFGGASARYFIRVSGDGQALLEAIGANGGVLLTEPRITTAPLVTNIPQADRPACFGDSGQVSGSLAPFIAAVFGGEGELQQVQQVLTPGGGRGVGGLTCALNPRFESARQGRFINAAECTGRNDAEAVVSFLRGRGFNSRLVYRNFRYR
jgi:hypothetical protein